MSNTKHTPWYVDDNGRIRAKGNDAIVAVIDDGCTLHGLENFTAAQQAQHAKLIAAAPDMAEALRECLPFVLKHKFDEDLQKAGDAMRAENLARAALAKAGVE